jgi:cytoskeletal protein CcmA (bactofilin family)
MIWRREDAEAAHDQGPGAHEPGARERAAKDQQEAMMGETSEVTIVGAGARLEGNVISAGSLRIEGQVKGQINAEGDVELAPQSQVEADIRAQNVMVAGRFRGNIMVSGKSHLARGGRVDGNITSKALVVEEGAIFHGQSIMDGGESGRGKGQAAGQVGSSEGEKSGASAPEQVTS